MHSILKLLTQKGRREGKASSIGTEQKKWFRFVWGTGMHPLNLCIDLHPFMKNEAITFLIKWHSSSCESQVIKIS